MTPEGKIKQWCRRKGGAFDVAFPGHVRVSPRGGPFAQTGVSDDILCYRGVFVAIEVKASASDHPTKLQMEFLQNVVSAGGVGAVLKGKDMHRLYAISTRVNQIINERQLVLEATHGL